MRPAKLCRCRFGFLALAASLLHAQAPVPTAPKARTLSTWELLGPLLRSFEEATSGAVSCMDLPKAGHLLTRSGRELMPHQVAVLESWRNAGHQGIVAFATGAGKTLTALRAVEEWTAAGRPALILVPGQELHRQWTAEIAL